MDLRNPEFWAERWCAFIDAHKVRGEYFLTPETWDRMAAEYKKREDHPAGEPDPDEALLDLLALNGALQPGMKVLDVGCGPGNLAIPLARRGCDVTACDISPAMLERLREDTPTDLNGSIAIRRGPWEELDIKPGSYDLVIANMTPAVNNPAGMDKMIAASRGWCYYASWAGPRTSEPWDEIIKIFDSAEQNYREQHFYYAMNYVFSLDLYPMITYRENTWSKDRDLAELAAEYARRLNVEEDRTTPVSEEEVAEALKKYSTDGKTVVISNYGRVGRLIWKVAHGKK